MSRPVYIVNLYPRQMNIYGDTGNVLVLTQRCKWRGIACELVNYNPGDPWPQHADLIVGGGGQDSGQSVIQRDLPRISEPLRNAVESGAAALAICGTYQLFGNYFEPADGPRIDGLGILDLHTVAGDDRLIGNITTQSTEFGSLVGYENHSGRTYLGGELEPLATVLIGAGNNGEDGREGARYRNVIGTYLHGPLLPKNPKLADHLIACALAHVQAEGSLVGCEGGNTKAGGTVVAPAGLPALAPQYDFIDRLAANAAQVAATRPR